ncbi:MAG: hypothetical protein IKE16_01950 [Solobacterium sp.]|nr:hypothetical protein [Solobacterium sp.]
MEKTKAERLAEKYLERVYGGTDDGKSGQHKHRSSPDIDIKLWIAICKLENISKEESSSAFKNQFSEKWPMDKWNTYIDNYYDKNWDLVRSAD